MMDLFFPNMDLFVSYYQLILIPLWPVLWDYKVPIFEVPIMGTFTNSDVAFSQLMGFVSAQPALMFTPFLFFGSIIIRPWSVGGG